MTTEIQQLLLSALTDLTKEYQKQSDEWIERENLLIRGLEQLQRDQIMQNEIEQNTQKLFIESLQRNRSLELQVISLIDLHGNLSESRIYRADNENFLNDFGVVNVLNVLKNYSENVGFDYLGMVFGTYTNGTGYFDVYKADSLIMEIICEEVGKLMNRLINKMDLWENFNIFNDSETELIDEDKKEAITLLMNHESFINDLLEIFENDYNIAD